MRNILIFTVFFIGSITVLFLLVTARSCTDKKWAEVDRRRAADMAQCKADGRPEYECRFIMQQIVY